MPYSCCIELKCIQPSFAMPETLQAVKTETKVLSFGSIPLHFISLNISSAAFPCPWIAYPIIIVFQEITSLPGILSKISLEAPTSPHLAYICITAFIMRALSP
uniref:Uncharacterized protein n=1 Tax=Arundo donax TaxID=35708 RepID=A0A0A9DDX1_ARUDO